MLNAKETRNCGLILRHALYGDSTPFPEDTDWAALRSIVELHRLESLVDCSSDPTLSPLQKPQNVFGHVLNQRILRQTVKKLFQEMKNRGIRAALLKGIELENCYPAGTVRTSLDIDLFVPGQQREAFSRMMEEMGIHRERDIHTGQAGVDTYVTAAGTKIEAHYILFSRMGSPQRKKLREMGFFSERFIVPGGGPELEYETFCPQAHLVYLIYHAAKHLTCHQLRLLMLADLAMFVNRYADRMDAAAFRKTMDELGLTRAANALFCFCARYLGMRGDFWRKTGPSMEWMLRRMMDKGTRHAWGYLLQIVVWEFYPVECVEKNHEYYIRYIYRPRRAFSNPGMFAKFAAWHLVRLIWHFDVDTSGEAT